MKVSKISLILLSSLLVCQGALPMETPANMALKKAQKAGKIALKIGTGATLAGVYALMGTAALASWGITLGAAALSLGRFLTPKAVAPQAKAAPEAPKVQANTPQKTNVKRPQAVLRPKNSPKNSKTARYTTGIQAAGMVGLAAVENDLLDQAALQRTHVTREQAIEIRKQQAMLLQAELAQCNEQATQWTRNYTRTYHAELPRYEGAYQDMIGIVDGDVEDMIKASVAQMKSDMNQKWKETGCKEADTKLHLLAWRMQQEQMRLPK